MAKRDHVAEILEIQARTGEKPPYIGVLVRIQDVKALIDGYDSPPPEALRYCPVGLVACIEAYFRAVIKQLIDSGEPFLERASRFDRMPFDFRVVTAIHGRTITLGSLVAHLLPCSNKNDINSSMSVLLDADFLASVKDVREHWPWKPDQTASAEPVVSDPATVFSDLDRVFELRHIVCHEFASSVDLSLGEAERFIKSVDTFLSAANFLVLNQLFKDLPDTQQERNVYFGKRFKAVAGDLRDTLESARAAFEGERLKKFLALQKLWEKYRDEDAEFVSGKYEGGSIRPQVHAQRLEQLTRRRIREVQELVENEEP